MLSSSQYRTLILTYSPAVYVIPCAYVYCYKPTEQNPMLVVPQVVLFLSHGDMKLKKVLKMTSDNTVCVCVCVYVCVCVCVCVCVFVFFCM